MKKQNLQEGNYMTLKNDSEIFLITYKRKEILKWTPSLSLKKSIQTAFAWEGK